MRRKQCRRGIRRAHRDDPLRSARNEQREEGEKEQVDGSELDLEASRMIGRSPRLAHCLWVRAP
jgi:hypothetical protein